MSSGSEGLIAIFRGGFTPAWSVASQDEKDAATSHWVSIHRSWAEMGAEILATMDDVYFRAGPPGGNKQWSFYEVWRVADFETIRNMLNLFRPQDGGLRLDKYFTIEVVAGPPIGDLEQVAREAAKQS